MANKKGLFWNSITGDRLYDADDFSEWLKKFFTTGVFLNDLQVTSTGAMGIKVAPGYTNIEGKVRFFDTDETFTLNAAHSTYPRIDTVVVERNNTNREITMKVVQGSVSGSVPSPTAPVRNVAIYQLVLAQIYIAAGATNITQSSILDKRMDPSVCGIVKGTVEEIDISQLTVQMQTGFIEWFDTIKGQLDGDTAANLQNQINELRGKMTTTVKNITLSASSWTSSNTYVVSDSLITATSNQEILPGLSITAQQLEALQSASIQDGGQTSGRLTLKAFGDKPSINIPIRIIFRGEK